MKLKMNIVIKKRDKLKNKNISKKKCCFILTRNCIKKIFPKKFKDLEVI